MYQEFLFTVIINMKKYFAKFPDEYAKNGGVLIEAESFDAAQMKLFVMVEFCEEWLVEMGNAMTLIEHEGNGRYIIMY